MFCKHCGGNISASDTKCKRCGKPVPARSDCGGFYDLVPGAPVVAPVAAPGAESSHAKDSDEKSKFPLEVIIIAAAALAIILILFVVMFIKIGKQADEITNLADEIAALENRNVPGETGSAGVSTEPTEKDIPTIPAEIVPIPENPGETTNQTTVLTEEVTNPIEEQEEESLIDWIRGGALAGEPFVTKTSGNKKKITFKSAGDTITPEIEGCTIENCAWGPNLPKDSKTELSISDLANFDGNSPVELSIVIKYIDKDGKEVVDKVDFGEVTIDELTDINNILKPDSDNNNQVSDESET